MVESVDTPDLKSVDHHGRGSSSLPTRMAQFSASSDQLLFDMQNFNINSTAISALSVDGDQVSVKYTSGEKEYTFQAQDPSTFVADLESCIADDQSVGSFIHQCRKQEQLTDVTV